jgi:RNA polymerase sigma factor (sigma-70 family)
MSGDLTVSFYPFPETQHLPGPPPDAEQLNALLERYRPAMRSYAHARFRLQPADAEDVIQEFILDKLILGDLLAVWDPARGRFRTLLRTALERFTIDWLRKRGRSRSAPLPESDILADDGPTAESLFDAVCEQELFAVACKKLREECARDLSEDWMLLEPRLADPPAGYEALGRRFGLSKGQVAGKLRRARERLASILHQLSQTEGDSRQRRLREETHFAGLTTSAEIYAHCLWLDLELLRAPLEGPLARTTPFPEEERTRHVLVVGRLAAESTPPLRTLGDLLAHPCPPLALLDEFRMVAKRFREEGGLVPAEVATVFYYVAIAAALARHGARISKLDDDDLRKGFAWD